MAVDPRFFASTGAQLLGMVVAAAEGRSDGDPARRFAGVAALQDAGPEEVSFLDDRRYLPALQVSRAGAVLLQPKLAPHLPAGTIAILTIAPALAFARVAALFHQPPPPRPGRHPTAVIEATATIGLGTEIGAHVVVGAGARIGRDCILHPHVVVGAGVEIGDGCRLHPHSSVSHALLGRGVVLHPGVRIGQEGFGFTPTPEGSFVTMPQLGRVILGDGVEVGANSCVDRGSQGDTVIGTGSRLDNLVQIGHNVRIGAGCIVVAQAGISGSATLGDFVTIAGQAGVAGHLRIGAKARVGAQAGVTSDVSAGTDVLGSPAWPVRETWRAIAQLRKLARGKGKAD